jgi:2-furoyl-CoA dehydrogenase large subunit
MPVAIANAVADALAPAGVEITSLPLHGSLLYDLLSARTSDRGVF